MATKLQRYPKVFSDKRWEKFCDKVNKISDVKESEAIDKVEDALIELGKMCSMLESVIRDLEQRVAELEDK